MLRSQNHELKAVLAKMEEEFPYLRHNLKKVNGLLPSVIVISPGALKSPILIRYLH